MLKNGFLDAVVDWVSNTVKQDARAHKKTTRQFNLFHLLQNSNEAEQKQFIGLFSEWLVFDYKNTIFDYQTGLSYFVQHNPLALSADDIVVYTEMLDFEAGLFEVKEIEIGKGLVLESVRTAKKQFVHDVSASMSARPTTTIWARIASVGGLYHIVGSATFVIPLKIMDGMRKEMAQWAKNYLNARDIALWIGNNKEKRFSAREEHEDEMSGAGMLETSFALSKAQEDFMKNLNQCGMGAFFTVENYQKWIENEDEYGLDFPIRALYFLMPEDTPGKKVTALMNAATRFANHLPRKNRDGKTPLELYKTKDENGRYFELNTYSRDAYTSDAMAAHGYMARGNFNASYKAFDVMMRRILDDKTPLFSSFRIYANAAVCLFHRGDVPLGAAFLEAALRINPLYDFAIRARKRYRALYSGSVSFSSKITVGKQEVGQWTVAVGERKYKKTVFCAYEKFLKELGVSLCYKTNTTPTIYRVDRL